MSPSLKRNGYSGGIVGVNGAKTRTNVISLSSNIEVMNSYFCEYGASLLMVGLFRNF